MHEYEVELQFTSSLVGQPDRTHDENGVIDGNEPVLGTEEDMSSTGDVRKLLSPMFASSVNVLSLEGESSSRQVPCLFLVVHTPCSQ